MDNNKKSETVKNLEEDYDFEDEERQELEDMREIFKGNPDPTLFTLDDEGKELYVHLDPVTFKPIKESFINDKGEDVYRDLDPVTFEPIGDPYV